MIKNLGKIFILAAIFAFLDQLIKAWAIKNLQNPLIILDNFFKLELSHNTGIAFGIDLPFFLLTILTVILIFVMIYLAIKEFNLNSKLSQILLAMILGGALGNLIDRFTYGFVIDFISIWRWPNFNLADSLIVIAILLILVFYGKMKKT